MPDPAAPDPSRTALAATRRHRFLLLRSAGQALRLLCLLGAGVTLAGFWACYSPTLADKVTAALARRMTAVPLAAYARMEQAAKAGDPRAAVSAAQAFMTAIPRPHPADAFGEKYRQALVTLMDSADALGDQALLLRTGELAQTFDPNDSLLLFKYGQVLAASGQHERALATLKAAFVIRPTAPQILHAIEPLLADQPQQLAELRQRHYEVLGLCMAFPSWMSGNLVATAEGRSQAFDITLEDGREVVLGGPLGFAPQGAYLVLPRVPELEIRVTAAFLIGADGATLALDPQPQDTLAPAADGFVRITPPDRAGFDDPSVIGFSVPGQPPPNSRLVVRVVCRPSPAVAAARRVFETGFQSHAKAGSKP